MKSEAEAVRRLWCRIKEDRPLTGWDVSTFKMASQRYPRNIAISCLYAAAAGCAESGLPNFETVADARLQLEHLEVVCWCCTKLRKWLACGTYLERVAALASAPIDERDFLLIRAFFSYRKGFSFAAQSRIAEKLLISSGEKRFLVWMILSKELEGGDENDALLKRLCEHAASTEIYRLGELRLIGRVMERLGMWQQVVGLTERNQCLQFSGERFQIEKCRLLLAGEMWGPLLKELEAIGDFVFEDWQLIKCLLALEKQMVDCSHLWSRLQRHPSGRDARMALVMRAIGVGGSTAISSILDYWSDFWDRDFCSSDLSFFLRSLDSNQMAGFDSALVSAAMNHRLWGNPLLSINATGIRWLFNYEAEGFLIENSSDDPRVLLHRIHLQLRAFDSSRSHNLLADIVKSLIRYCSINTPDFSSWILLAVCYQLMGCFTASYEVLFKKLRITNIQLDTLGFLYLASGYYAGTFTLVKKLVDESWELYEEAQDQVENLVVKAFSEEEYLTIYEISLFQRTLLSSRQRKRVHLISQRLVGLHQSKDAPFVWYGSSLADTDDQKWLSIIRDCNRTLTCFGEHFSRCSLQLEKAVSETDLMEELRKRTAFSLLRLDDRMLIVQLLEKAALLGSEDRVFIGSICVAPPIDEIHAHWHTAQDDVAVEVANRHHQELLEFENFAKAFFH